MHKITYSGPGNNWDVTVYKSALTGKKVRMTGVPFRTACTFVKTHTAMSL